MYFFIFRSGFFYFLSKHETGSIYQFLRDFFICITTVHTSEKENVKFAVFNKTNISKHNLIIYKTIRIL